MSAESPGPSGRIHNWRLRFRAWRGSRPFWAGLLTLLGGVPIAYFPYANLTVGQLTIRMATTAGAGSLVIGVLLMVLGLTMWYQSVARVFAGVAAIMLAIVSLVVSNIGGFLMGFLLALVGGGLAISWAPSGGRAGQRSAGHGDDPREDGGAAPEPAVAGAGGLADDESKNGRHRAG
ncbi:MULTISPECIES: DUF6114 domain-containing protein [Streptomyces]|uniref:Integral membrane protein n=1 Tax=Streptomyces lycii TaxID=2654337 RepID=A0ABQ7FMR5_9ACTN|nr:MULTISPECIES: DUF6114 domain-containing protein [Streptomyces]KAF4409273.1 hypothetical protein GCU69_09860 [Streptomyces lycii]PGH48236.1 hypothetical protein CRI70_24125 [Streptomyces sp. Ru87]